MTPEELYLKYGVRDPVAESVKYRNPLTPELVAYSEKEGRRLASETGIAGARNVLGGSLSYNAAMVGDYDIDLRVLLPIGADDQCAIDVAADRIDAAEHFTSARTIIEEGTGNYIRHFKLVKRAAGVTGTPEVKFTLNVQSAAGYAGVAATSAKMPRLVQDRYVVAKGMSKKDDACGDNAGVSAYKIVKAHWMDMIAVVRRAKADRFLAPALSDFLAQYESAFPLFLRAVR